MIFPNIQDGYGWLIGPHILRKGGSITSQIGCWHDPASYEEGGYVFFPLEDVEKTEVEQGGSRSLAELRPNDQMIRGSLALMNPRCDG